MELNDERKFDPPEPLTAELEREASKQKVTAMLRGNYDRTETGSQSSEYHRGYSEALWLYQSWLHDRDTENRGGL